MQKNSPATIPIQQSLIDSQQVQTVNARDLHSFLEIKKDFTNWIKDQIKRARLAENMDFIVLAQKGVNPSGGRPSSDYHLTIEAGKHVSMMCGTDKGFEVRDYFIECEKATKAPAQIDLNDPTLLRNALLTYTEKVLELENKVGEQVVVIADLSPKAAAHDLLSTATGSLCITDAAKNLQIKPSVLFGYLSGAGWIYRRAGSIAWIAYQGKLQQGLLEHKIKTIERPDGSEKITEQVRVTSKGLAKLAETYGARKAA